MKTLRLALFIAVAAPLGGCAASHLIVEQPATQVVHVDAVTLAYDDTTTAVPQSASAYVQHKMENAFFGGDHPLFQKGTQMTVRYHFVGYDAGSRVGRYFAGTFGVGEAQMVLEAVFVDGSGNTIARVRGQGQVRAGFFGGSANTGIDKAVKEIARYATEHFKR
jgi:hypothetical protein